MTKKGSHVGIVLSFVIFVTFVMFFYIIVQPALTTESKHSILNTLKKNIIEEVSSELTTASMSIEPAQETCAKLDHFFGIAGIGNKIIILDGRGNIITATKNSQDLYIEREDSYDTFFKVYESEEFDQIESEDLGCDESNYELGLIKTTTEVFETKILEIIDRHESDYQDLKQELGVPIGNEFGLDFVYANRTEITTEDTSVKINIFSREFPIKYVTENAAIEIGILRIKVW
jgi:hypothetical protein